MINILFIIYFNLCGESACHLKIYSSNIDADVFKTSTFHLLLNVCSNDIKLRHHHIIISTITNVTAGVTLTKEFITANSMLGAF